MLPFLLLLCFETSLAIPNGTRSPASSIIADMVIASLVWNRKTMLTPKISARWLIKPFNKHSPVRPDETISLIPSGTINKDWTKPGLYDCVKTAGRMCPKSPLITAVPQFNDALSISCGQSVAKTMQPPKPPQVRIVFTHKVIFGSRGHDVTPPSTVGTLLWAENSWQASRKISDIGPSLNDGTKEYLHPLTSYACSSDWWRQYATSASHPYQCSSRFCRFAKRIPDPNRKIAQDQNGQIRSIHETAVPSALVPSNTAGPEDALIRAAVDLSVILVPR